MALSPSAARSTAYVCSRSPLASTCAACGSSSTRSTRMVRLADHSVRRVHPQFILRPLDWGSEMRCSIMSGTLSLAGALRLGAAALGAAEKNITAKDLPPAVAKAVQEVVVDAA